MTEVIFARSAGLDVHKKSVVACRRILTEDNEVQYETQTFGTMTEDLLVLSDWLTEWEITHVAMESTGEYWKPIYNILEGNFTLYLVNARHVKHVPARKTDVKDAEWLAKLMQLGLLTASFIPEKPQRDLRDLTRERKALIRERTRVSNRIQKVLETANIKLAAVASDVLGTSGRLMLRALVEGETDVVRMAELAKGRLRKKIPELRKALTGRIDDHHRFLLQQHLQHIEFLERQIAALDQEIIQRIETMSQPSSNTSDKDGSGEEGPMKWQEAVDIVDTAPGIDRRAAQTILAETGIDMSRFPSDRHITAWAGLAPGNHESGGKHYSGRTKKGNKTLRSVLTQAAWAAVRTKGTYLSALYRRLAARRGKKRAIIAVARALLVSIYHMLSRREPYRELGADYLNQRRKEAKVNYHMRQIRRLGYAVALQPLPLAA